MLNHLYSRPMTQEEVRQWERANSHDDNDSIYQGEERLPASTGIDRVELWTTQEEDSAPSIAYLVGPNVSTSGPMPCLRISIKVKRKDLNQKGMAVGKPVVKLEIGYCPQSLIAGCHVKISAKQTPKQNWLAAVWKKVHFRLSKKSMAHPEEGAFTMTETLRSGAIDKQSTVRLIMMMYSEFWKRGEHPDEAKKSDVDAFDMVPQSSRSAFGAKYRRMEFKVTDEG